MQHCVRFALQWRAVRLQECLPRRCKSSHLSSTLTSVSLWSSDCRGLPSLGLGQCGSIALSYACSLRGRFLRACALTLRCCGARQSSTRDFIMKHAVSSLNVQPTVIATMVYNLPATYKHHKEKSKDIEVDLWCFECRRPQ